MTDNTQPEALDLADWLEAVGGGPSAKRCAALLREQHARITALESQLAQRFDAADMATAAAEPAKPIGYLNPKVLGPDGKIDAPGALTYSSRPCGGWTFPIYAAAPAQPAAQQGVAYADAHGAIMGAAYDFRDDHISGSPNQKRSAHAALESAVAHAMRASHGQAPALTNLNCKSEQKRLATLWGFVQAQADTKPAHQWDVGYPPLPEPDIVVGIDGQAQIFTGQGVVGDLYFTADQMRAYIDSDRAARAPADSVLEDAARWRDWTQAFAEASAAPEDTVFMKAFEDAIGDSDAPFTAEQFTSWVDAARKQGEKQ